MADTGGVDSSIALQAGQGVQQQNNPLQTASQYIGLQNALQQQQLYPGQIQQQQNELSLFPGQKALQQQAVSGGALGLAQKTNQAAYSMLSPLLSDPTMTHDKLTTALAGIEAAGIPTGGVIADFQKSLPGGDGPGFQKSFRTLVGARMLTSPDSQLAATVGTPSSMTNGQQIQPGSTGGVLSAQPGAFTPGGAPTQVYPSRGELLTQQPGIDPATGQPTAVPLATRATAQGAGSLTGPAGAPTVPSPFGTGRLPAALLRNPSGAVSPAEPGGAVATGLSPAQHAALATQGVASANAFQNIADQGVQAKAQSAALGNMLADTTLFTPGQTDLNNVKAAITKYSPTVAASIGATPESVAANESFDKLASQIALSQGAGTDSRLAVAGSANPSSHLSASGADQMIRTLQGNAAYLQARAQLASQFPDQSNRAAFESQVGSKLDPRAFQFSRLTAPQKVTFVKGLSPQDRTALQKSYNFAATNGLIGGESGQ